MRQLRADTHLILDVAVQTACSRLRSSTVEAHGAASRPSNTQHSNGPTGSTTAACLSLSGTSRPRRPKQTSTQLWKLNPWPRN